MVLIPNDIGIRMRLQAESALLQPTAPVQGIPSDLPELRPGQTFRAQIQESLPDNTYRALVAGKSLTLSLPEGAKAGDALDLIVVERSSKSVVAQLANRVAGSEGPAIHPYAEISPAAKLISSLLTEHGTLPAPVALTRGEPVLATPPVNVAQLASSLANAVAKSGIFYEAHQADWLAGKMPLTELLEEPQARHSDFKSLIEHLLQTNAANQPDAPEAMPLVKSVPMGRHTLDESMQLPHEGVPLVPRESTNSAATIQSSTQAQSPGAIPEDIRPLVQQQLDALATNRLAWHGEVWPQQQLEWEIERDSRHRTGEVDVPDSWITSLKLSLPTLGEVAAKLYLTADGINLAIQVSGEMIPLVNDAVPLLEGSLAAAGVPLLGSLVRPKETEDTATGTSSISAST